ncbi:MAG: response regulator [Vampirovibrio sp.]|nr:response regulator [Vampirovibrio sp.]
MPEKSILNTQTTTPRLSAGTRAPLVWVVDDQPVVTTSLKALILLESSFDVQTFQCPEEALERLKSLSHNALPDVIISDYNMPKLTGIEFLKAVKKLHPNLTLILLTGYADKQNAIESINEAGVFRYLEKPWDNDALLHTLHQAYERTHLIDRLDQKNAELALLNQNLERLVKARTQALEEAHQELETLIEHSADGIVGLNAEGNISLCNKVFTHWVAQSTENPALQAENILNTPIEQWLPNLTLVPPNQQHASAYLELTLGAVAIEASYAQVGNAIEVSADPTTSPQTIWILRDVTQRKAIERLRDDFMATLTHDLRTPLHAAIQGIQFLQKEQLGPTTSAQQELLTVFHQSHEDMLHLVNTLLDCYRYEAGQHRLVFDETELLPLVEQVCQALAPLAGSRGQTLAYETLDESEASMPAVFGDKHELKRVIKNLVGNAIAHTPKGGSLQVGFKQWERLPENIPLNGCSPFPDAIIAMPNWKNQPWVGVWIKDNGRGISEADQKLLFHRFSQGSSIKRNSGSGLGLYLSAQIMQAHTGVLWVESTVGEGSTFFMALPVKK